MIEKQEKNHSNTFYQKIRKTAKTLEIEIVKKKTGKEKPTWKKEVREKMISKVKKR